MASFSPMETIYQTPSGISFGGAIDMLVAHGVKCLRILCALSFASFCALSRIWFLSLLAFLCILACLIVGNSTSNSLDAHIPDSLKITLLEGQVLG